MNLCNSLKLNKRNDNELQCRLNAKNTDKYFITCVHVFEIYQLIHNLCLEANSSRPVHVLSDGIFNLPYSLKVAKRVQRIICNHIYILPYNIIVMSKEKLLSMFSLVVHNTHTRDKVDDFL